MRHPLKTPLAPGLLLLAAATVPACTTSAPTTNTGTLSPTQQRIAQASAQWPIVDPSDPALKRPFFATIHIAGHRTTASGLLQFHNPRDFRITAVTEMGSVLFDGRMNWAGVEVIRSLPGIDKSIIETLLRDLATAFQLPASVATGTEKNGEFVIHDTGADTNKYTWTFDARSGRLRTTDVSLGLFDTLHIAYLRYNAAGWPAEILVTRKARLYTINLTFTDDTIAARSLSGNPS
jgi:hypothetical protein